MAEKTSSHDEVRFRRIIQKNGQPKIPISPKNQVPQCTYRPGFVQRLYFNSLKRGGEGRLDRLE